LAIGAGPHLTPEGDVFVLDRPLEDDDVADGWSQ
jgi:hypothetical protein